MKAFLAALAVAALCAFLGCVTRGHATEAGETVEDPAATGPKLPQGALTCAFEDHGNTLIHVLLCRFAESEECVLTAPMPFEDMMQRFEAMKILKIGTTPEGCSELTIRGTLKDPE